ncbi:LmeA family phospholipid-binding protein [Lolliginicoccus levis]|uniref:LmeA family phospholipid-binding protein n=1 Tax=Lolliginicoccus levis TaxID=2919542 RepID=UPI00241C5283|nr:DUF2993 domain-containing protein [Lolliginicoccus levis]
MRKLILGVLVLLAAAIIAELGTAAYAEHRISRALRDSAQLDSDPQVILRGFPVLPQIITGQYDKIDIQVEHVPTDYAGRVSLEAALTGARITPDRWYQQRITALAAEELTGRVVMGQTELGRQFDLPDLRLSFFPVTFIDAFDAATEDVINRFRPVMLTATPPESIDEEPVTVEARLRLEGNVLTIAPLRFYNGPNRDRDIPIPEELREQALRSFEMTMTIPEVPFSQEPAYAYPQGGRIVVEAITENVRLDLDHDRATDRAGQP